MSKVTDAILNKEQFGPGRNAPELDLLKGRPGWHPGQEVEEVGPLLNQELLRTDVPTPSGRIYPREEVQRALDDELFKKSMRLRALRGESESPKMPPFVNEARRIVRVVSIDQKLVSHEISDIVIDEAGVVRGTVKAVGPHKAALENLIRGGYQPTFGMRALANFKKVDGVEVVQPGSLKIMTFDLIGHQEGPKEEKPAFWPDNPLEG